MRRVPTFAPILGSLALSAAFGLACAGTQTAKSSVCLDRCTNIQSSLDRSTCELDCQRVAGTTAPAAVAPPPAAVTPTPAATPAPAPANATAPASKYPPLSSTYTQPANQPPPPRPVTPTPAPTVVVPAGPSYAELQQQRASCESGCDSETVASDRSTCRLQCAQITNRPTAPASSGTPTYVSPPGTIPNTSGATRPVAVDPQVLASCLSTCNDASTPDTDRATCRLQCNANGSVGPAPSSYYVLGGAPPSDADQRAAVIRSSQGNAGTVTPPSGTPQSQQKIAACAATAQQCATTCTAQSAPCTAACDQGKMSGTDRATCKLTCESNVEVCRDDCRIQEGKCRSKP